LLRTYIWNHRKQNNAGVVASMLTVIANPVYLNPEDGGIMLL
jgi:hypothetical protein